MNMNQNKIQQHPEKTPKVNPLIGFFWGILIVLLLNGLIFPNIAQRQIKDTDYSTFINKVDNRLVKEVAIKNGQIFFTTEEDGRINTYQTGAMMVSTDGKV